MFKLLGGIAVPYFLAVIGILRILDAKVVINPPSLIPVLNLLFFGIVPLIVAYISAKSYLASGSRPLLYLSSGTMLYGVACIIASILLYVQATNPNFTVQTSAYLLSAALQFVSATSVVVGASFHVSKFRKLRLSLAYLGMLVFIALMTIASLQGIIPRFYVQETGPTMLRQTVVATAIILFAISSILFMKTYFKTKSEILYWYSLALVLIALALFSFLLQQNVGDPFGWTGRMAHYLGSVYLLVAVIVPIRKSKQQENTINISQY